MTDVLYDKLVYGRELTREQWQKIKYRPFSDSDMYAIIEDPSFGIDKSEIGPVIPTDRILYRALTKPSSTWIDENCSENVFDESTGEGYLILKEGVTELIGWQDSETGIIYTVFLDIADGSDMNDNVKEIIIPNGITNIGSYAFAGCMGITKFIIPDSVTSIGDGAFANCALLTSVTCLATTPPILGIDAFANIATTICGVPEDSIELYYTSDWWNYFTDFAVPTEVEIRLISEPGVGGTISPIGTVTAVGHVSFEIYREQGYEVLMKTAPDSTTTEDHNAEANASISVSGYGEYNWDYIVPGVIIEVGFTPKQK